MERRRWERLLKSRKRLSRVGRWAGPALFVLVLLIGALLVWRIPSLMTVARDFQEILTHYQDSGVNEAQTRLLCRLNAVWMKILILTLWGTAFVLVTFMWNALAVEGWLLEIISDLSRRRHRK